MTAGGPGRPLIASSTSRPLVSGRWGSRKTISTPASAAIASAPVLTWVASPSPLAASTCCTRRTILESSSTRRIRGTPLSATCGGLAGAEPHPAELLPSGLALPGVEQPSQSPVQSELAVSEILQHRVDQQNQHLLAPSKRQESALESVGQSCRKRQAPSSTASTLTST